MMRRAFEADFIFQVQGYSDELRVLGFRGAEGISEPFQYNLELAARDAGIDFGAIVGKTASLHIYGEVGERYVNGIVTRLVQAGVGNRYTVYHAEMMPAVWLLSMRYKSRIFQEMSAQDIIKQVFQDAGIQSNAYRFALQGTHNPREYCVQYRESDLDFISRLMEEEGIFYFFEHSDEKHVMVIADNSGVHVPIESPDTIVFNEPSGMVAEKEHVYEYRFTQQIRSGAVVLRDFNYERPTLDLEVSSTSGADGKLLEIYDYPGGYLDQNVGSVLTQLRLEATRSNRQVGSGRSVCRRFIPGYRFTLELHPRSDFNQEYLITRVSSSGAQPLGEDASGPGFHYSNAFECIPFSVPYRPARKTPKPVVRGVQSAFVVGPRGEEIYTDEHGRVKVQFHWDREGQMDENSSCWMRVSQGWAGMGWGAIFIPRIGQEVIVDFLEGDPDRPIITGRVYNGDHPVPYGLPKDKTKSTIKSDSSPGGGGSNEFRFEDSKGKEEVYLHAQKDWTIVIENDKNQRVGHDETLNVGNNRTKSVGNDQKETIGHDKTIKVTHNHNETIGNDMTIDVGKNLNETIGNNMTLRVSQNLNETIGNNMTLHVGQNLNEDVGGNHSEQVKKDYSLKAKRITLQADDQIVLKTGSAQIVMKNNGNIQIIGNQLQIKGSGNVTIKGSKIAEN